MAANPHLQTCWHVYHCQRKRCPAYGREGVRCWHQMSSFCFFRTKQAISIFEKWQWCRRCKVFLDSTPDIPSRMVELQNNILFLTEGTSTSMARFTEQKSRLLNLVEHYKLSPRETDVLILLLDRHTQIGIAEYLSLSRETIKTHMKAIQRKVGVHSKLALLEVFLGRNPQGAIEVDRL